MANFWNSFLNQIITGDNLKDYQHAARTFVDGLYRLGPKSTSLFHVFMDVDTQATNVRTNEQIELGMMAKTVSLPKFTIQNEILNSYNRKNVIQKRMTYDPVTITFHDDSADVVRNFWYDYYSYYYRDSDYSESLYSQAHRYKQRQTQDWGYSPRSVGAQGTVNYLKSIRIYSLHQKSFSSYILIRPTITSFQHGQHTQGEYDTMQHSMTVSYEAVQYEYGPVNSGTVQGFNVIHYDNIPSPLTVLGGGTQSILGPGGLVDALGTISTNLQSGNYGTAILSAIRSGKNFSQADLSKVVTSEFQQTILNILRGQNSQSSIFVPTASSIQEGLSKAVNSIVSNNTNMNG